MPRLSDIGLAPAATLRRPSRTMAQASTVAVVVPSPATSSVFLATSLTSSAPIFSYGSSSSISLAMDTPSLVIVGAPHFFSRTTLRPFGPRVTRTASASLFMPRSRARRASSSKAISLGMAWCPPCDMVRAPRWRCPGGRGPGFDPGEPRLSDCSVSTLIGSSANSKPRRPRGRNQAGGSAAGHRRDDGDGLALGHRGLEALEEADVLVGHEDVHEAAQRPGVVEQAVGETGVGGVEVLRGPPRRWIRPGTAPLRRPDRVLSWAGMRTVTLTGLSCRDRPGRDRRPGPRRRRTPPGWGRWWLVGPTVEVRASTVLSPWPVM